MKITLESYGNRYIYESSNDDLDADELKEEFSRLLVAAGYPPNVIQCSDGGHYDCSYVDDWEEPEGDKEFVRNRVKCEKCDDIIESKSAHDFVTCKCGAISVDGGPEHTRVIGEPGTYVEISEWKEK